MIVTIICGSSLLVACGGPTAGPDEQLRQWVVAGQTAVEAKERRTLVRMISPAYSDADGNGREDIENLFRFYFLRQNHIKLLISVDEIRLYDDTAAEIDLTVGMAGTNDRAFGFSADADRFELELVRNNDDWLLISARWGVLGKD